MAKKKKTPKIVFDVKPEDTANCVISGSCLTSISQNGFGGMTVYYGSNPDHKLWTDARKIVDVQPMADGHVSGVDRPSFDDIYMEFARLMSLRSTCERTQVGAVVVTVDNHRVLAVGYNGGPKGLWNRCMSPEPGKCGHLHAEVNALIKHNYHDVSQKKIYVTSSPCFACAVAIINASVREVIYLDEYRDTSGLELLRDAGIVVRQHTPERISPRNLHLKQDGQD